jgi:site-specific DNA recombinase
MMADQVTHGVGYCRISDSRQDNGNGKRERSTKGVDDQKRRIAEHAKRLGWKLTTILVENDTSAFKRRKVTLPNGDTALRVIRPEFRKALDGMSNGTYDGMLALDLDRACRDPKDLEDLIDLVESRTPRIPITATTGSLDLSNDSGILAARINVSVANKSSRDTSRRVAESRERNALAGEYGGGTRKYGFEMDGVTRIESECREIATMAEALLGGGSLRFIALDLNKREVPTALGLVGRWASDRVRSILLRPRNAGLMIYKGEVVEGVKAPWEPIISRASWEAISAKLKDPDRKKSPGNQPKHLLSGLARCGHAKCKDANNVMRVHGSYADGASAFRCTTGHNKIHAAKLTEMVQDLVIDRLSLPDAANLIELIDAGIDRAALAREGKEIEGKLDLYFDMLDAGEITRAQYNRKRDRYESRSKEIALQLSEASSIDPIAGIAGEPNAREIWEKLPLGRQRAIINRLMVLTIKSGSRSRGRMPDGSYFDVDRVDVDWLHE